MSEMRVPHVAFLDMCLQVSLLLIALGILHLCLHTCRLKPNDTTWKRG